MGKKIKELEIKHEKKIRCLKRWEKIKIYFNKLIVIKKFELLKEKISRTFKNLKMLIKKKKNELLIKEKLNNKFDSYHNKIPLENINSWRYSVSFQNIYNDNPDILKIFKLKNNYTINNLKEIMNIHKFTTYDWLVWSEIVIEKKRKN